MVISSTRLLILLFIFCPGLRTAALLAEDLSWERASGHSQCREGAKVVGIPIVRVSALTFGLGVALAASAGVFYVTLFTVTPVMGIPLTSEVHVHGGAGRPGQFGGIGLGGPHPGRGGDP